MHLDPEFCTAAAYWVAAGTLAGNCRSLSIDQVAVQDVVTRYASQTGHHVERRFGWDCHGLPVEFEIDKKLSACPSPPL